MFYSNDDIKKIEDFQKYARFICEHFDIQVELDSTKAETDGKVIKLPNVIGMSDEELDMIYTILLHEAGHIKFSNFTQEAFAKLKTSGHAYLANSIEDARIENLLIKEFAGAYDMFEKMYSEYAIDRKLMKKVFNITGKRVDLFNSLGIYIHAYLIDCKTAAFSKVVTRENYIKIKSFVNKYKIDTILEQSNLKDWDDVVDLTNTIYDLFVKQFHDSSEKLNFAKDLALKKETEAALEALKNEIKATQEKLEKVQEKIKEDTVKLKDWNTAHADELKSTETEKSELEQTLRGINETLKNRNNLERAKNQLSSNTNKNKTNQDKLEKLKNELQSLKDALDKGLNPKGKPFTEKQKEATQKSFDSKQKQEKSLSEKAQESQKKKNESQKDFDDLNVPETSSLKDVSSETLQEQQRQFQGEKNVVDQKYREMTAERYAIEQSISNHQKEIDGAAEKMQEKIMNNMYELDKKGLGQSLPIDLLPAFEETPGWEEADKAQQDFDREASKERKEVVRNGGRMAGLIGTNLRDLSVYIDNKLENVKEINLRELFEKKVGVSRFPQLNEGEKGMMTNTMTDKSIRPDWAAVEKHTVLTTQFDIVKNENLSKNSKEVSQLMIENQQFIKTLTRTFTNKFKFTKKDYYRGGKEEGQLDARNLWKLPTKQGDDYFEVNNPKFVNKMAASILIDISGSHDKEETEYGKKLKVLALGLSESLKSVHVSHEILGFHAPVCDEMREVKAAYSYNRRSNKLETLVYKTFSQKDNNGIGNIDIQPSDNSDGESIRIALSRLKRERSKSKVLFIITDGKPFLSDGDVTIIDADLKKALREAVQQKIQIFALGFAPNGQDFYGERFCYIQELKDVVKFVDNINL